jgi:threonine dehydrogenase-like Zn-dependent dehydrogenase
MRAFVMSRIGEVRVTEKPVPVAGPNDAIVRTTSALICTSDTHTVAGAIGDRTDLTLGHEAVGTVASLGAAVRGFHVGQRVAVNAITPCWRCENCQRGYPSQCGGLIGGWRFANAKDGSLAEFFHVNDAEGNLVAIPDEVPDEQAVYCCDMMSTGFAAAENAAIPIGGSVAIFGQGPVGLMATQGARLLGAGLIIAVEGVPARKELALHFGADLVIDPHEPEAADRIREWSGSGVDGAIEALGSPETFAACVRVTRPGGTISNVGYHGMGESVPIPRLDWGVGMSDQVIRTALCPGGSERMRRLLRLLVSGRVDPTPLTTHRFGFAQVECAFHMMQTHADGMIKPLIRFD